MTERRLDPDPRLIFLHRAHARLILFDAGKMDLDEAIDGLMGPCPCARDIVAMWERKYPRRRHWGRK